MTWLHRCAVLVLWIAVAVTASAQTMTWELPFFGVHRGGAAWRPEHTLATYHEVVAQWPDAILECDVRVTKDGSVVLNHDETVDRTTNGTGSIADMTLADVKALDAGYGFSPDGGVTFPYRGKGLTIATLEELLQTFPKSFVLIELKDQPGIVGATAHIITKCNAEERVLIASFQSETMQEVENVLPRAARCFSMATGMRLLGALRGTEWQEYTPEDHVLALGLRMLRQFDVTAEEVARIQAKGVRVQLYDVDTEGVMHDALALGVDSVLTDRPDLLANVLKSHTATSHPSDYQDNPAS